MSGPWEKYQAAPSVGPWEKYQEQNPVESADQSFEFERSGQYPTAAMTDPSIQDYMVASGVAGLGKAGAGAAGKLLTKTIAPTLERSAANQALRSLGASVGQVRQLGVEPAREAGKYALDKGLVDVFSSEIGRETKLKTLSEATGKTIGELREMAGSATPGMAKQIETELAPKYASGVYSGEKGGLEKALEEVKNSGQTNADLAKTATKLNEYAAGAKLTQPANAATDVANALSRANNADIAHALGSEKAGQYVGALEDYSKIKPLEAFVARGEAKEAAGLGSNTMYGSLTRTLKNAAGHRIGAKVADIGAEVVGGIGNLLPNAQEGASLAIPATKTIGGVIANLMTRIQSNPQSLGRYATPLMQAAQTNGSKGLAATHFILANQYPDYNEMILKEQENETK
jgi:hypothetical protein